MGIVKLTNSEMSELDRVAREHERKWAEIKQEVEEVRDELKGA
ncbi:MULTISPECIES: hypothetical protein [Mycolicibacter]|uniref:Antitoxin n=2 Tax=Mycolicibacter TaxID=1073531 RepID=A0ABU5XM27_9MYCO|nr:MULTISPECIES: hypothetical protein [unclassified Mycolicibacter]MEB3023333.1 hypothetical protein [Mycolicibacter sp. MYC098]MEB3035131.1 hypothetical protein [Mycolicibacter sp. MYC340]